MKGASQPVSLATNGDIQAINAGSPNVHINLHTVQKVDGGKGKMVGEQPCPINTTVAAGKSTKRRREKSTKLVIIDTSLFLLTTWNTSIFYPLHW